MKGWQLCMTGLAALGLWLRGVRAGAGSWPGGRRPGASAGGPGALPVPGAAGCGGFAGDAGEAWELAIHALEHDVRAPQATLLALVALRQPHAAPDAIFAGQVAACAREALDGIDALVRLLRETRHRYGMGGVALDELMSECVDRAWGAAREAGVWLECTLPPAGTSVSADRDKLGEVLALLLGSAVAGSRPGSVVRLQWREAAGAHALRVSFCPALRGGGEPLLAYGPAALFVQRVLARHGGRIVPLSRDGAVADASPGGNGEDGWVLLLPVMPVPTCHTSAA